MIDFEDISCDLKFDFFREDTDVRSPECGARVTHVPTGISAYGGGYIGKGPVVRRKNMDRAVKQLLREMNKKGVEIKFGPMRALTIWPEWLFAIQHLGKRVENRTWTQKGVVGERIVLHAGVNIGGRPGKRAAESGLLALGGMAVLNGWSWMLDDELKYMSFGGTGDGRYPVDMVIDSSSGVSGKKIAKGAFVGTAVVSKITKSDIWGGYSGFTVPPWGADGQYHWHLDGLRFFKDPIPAKGKQKLWRLADDQVLAISHADVIGD